MGGLAHHSGLRGGMSDRNERRSASTRATDGKPTVGSLPGPRGLELVRSFEGLPPSAYKVVWSADGTLLAASGRGSVVVWSNASGERRLLHGQGVKKDVLGLAWHPTRSTLAIASRDGSVRLWDADSDSDTSRLFCSTSSEAMGVTWSPDGSSVAINEGDGDISVWDAQLGERLQHTSTNQKYIKGPCWSPDGRLLVTTDDQNINIRTSNDLQLVRELRAHSNTIYEIALSHDGTLVASASEDKTVRVWNLATGAETAILEGHNEIIGGVRFSPDGEFLASRAGTQVWLWRCRDWEHVATLPRVDAAGIGGVDFHPYEPLLAAKDRGSGRIDCYRIDYALLGSKGVRPDSRRYCNAKVVLLGDTGVGKSGLGLVLSGQSYQPTDSTHGRRVWTFDSQEVEVSGAGKQTREVLLWDLAGQPGYRLVHQLHLNEVAVALIVFDSRSETDPFAGVKHWVRALAQARRLEGASAVPLRAYLVAARADRGGVAVTMDRIRAMIDDLGLDGFFETSAKEGWQITELAAAIRDGIIWDALPMVSSSALFDSIKQFLLEEKQRGRLLSTADDLFHSFRRTHPDNSSHGGLRASFESCIGRVESRGLIRRLQFGDLVLLQPELLDAYASAMVQAAKEQPDGLGFIREEAALEGRFRLAADERIGDRAHEKLLLIATVQELLRYEIALKEATDQGVDLIFPSQFTRERPDTPDIRGRYLTFTFEGPLYSIYASLAVRLSQSSLFRRQSMWQHTASYTATVGGTCGINLRELHEGKGELVLFYDEQAGTAVRAQFETYVAEHLELRAIPGTVTRQRVRACPNCSYVLPEDLVQRRLSLGMTTIRCPLCEVSVISLLDEEPSARAEAAVTEMNRRADERRDLNVAATRLKGKIVTGDYDVFLCHNSKDKQNVIAIAKRLKERGILPWLDIWEIRPGMRWQKELQKNLKSVKSAAVFVGPRGAGPWQELEVESLLQQLARRNRTIIPVILEGRQGRPRLPAFLDMWHVVDMRQPDPDPFEQLIWGITGERSDQS